MKIKVINLPDDIHSSLQKEDNASALITKLLRDYFERSKLIERIDDKETTKQRIYEKKLEIKELEDLQLKQMKIRVDEKNKKLGDEKLKQEFNIGLGKAFKEGKLAGKENKK